MLPSEGMRLRSAASPVRAASSSVISQYRGIAYSCRHDGRCRVPAESPGVEDGPLAPSYWV